MKPVAEIMFGDLIALAMDQIANQAAKLRYMFGGGLTLSTTEVGRFSVCWPHGFILPSSGLCQGNLDAAYSRIPLAGTPPTTSARSLIQLLDIRATFEHSPDMKSP